MNDHPDGAEFCFEMLGPFRAFRAGVEIDTGTRMQEAVLISLLLAKGHVASVDRLIEQLWGETPRANPQSTLRSYISNLRRILEPGDAGLAGKKLIATRSPGYVLDAERIATDVEQFRRLLGEAQAHLGQSGFSMAEQYALEALALWRSDDLASGPLGRFPSEVTQLLEERLVAIETLLESQLALGKHRDVIPQLQALVADEPLRERIRELLMVALYRAGRAPEALDVMTDARSRFIEALGIDPSPRLTGIELQILQQDPALDWTAPAAAAGTQPADHTSAVGGTAVGGTAVGAATVGAGLVGRDLEFTRSLEAIETSHSVVVFNGEPGIGKSALVRALATTSGQRGRVVAWGRCFDGGQASTLWPWATVLRDLVERYPDDELPDVLGRQAEDLARLLPEVADHLGLNPGPPADIMSFYDSLVRLLRRFADDQPLLLAFEDLHWADSGTARLLALAVDACVDSPIAFLATWRSTEVLPDNVATALAEVGRSASPCRFDLKGLDREAITAMYRRLRTDEPDAALLERIERRTAGNPLFVNELLYAPSLDPAEESTATVSEAIASRLAALPSRTRRILAAASVNRSGFSVEMLSMVMSIQPSAIVTGLDAAGHAGIVASPPRDGGEFEFTHSLMAEQVLSELSADEAADWYARTGQAYENLGESERVSAYYYLRGARAGSAPQGVRAALIAAEKSTELHDHDGAYRLLSDSLDALRVARESEDAAETSAMLTALQAEVLVARCQTEKYLQRVEDAQASAIQAFELSRSISDVNGMSTAALVYCGQALQKSLRFGGRWLGYWNPPGPALEMLSQCLDLIESDSPTKASLQLAYTSELHGEHVDDETARKLSDEALRSVRALDEPDLLAGALFTRHTALQRSLTLEERAEILNEMLAISVAADLPARELFAHRALFALNLDLRDRGAALATIEAAEDAASRCDDDLMAMWPRAMRISLLLLEGDAAAAEPMITQAFGEFSRAGSAVLDTFGIQYSVIMRMTGQFDDLIAVLTEREAEYSGPGYGMPLAGTLIAAGRIDEARALIDRIPRSLIVAGGESVLQFTPLSYAADTAYALGDVDLGADLYQALQPAAGRLVSMSDGLFFHASGSLFLGRLAILLGQHDDGRKHLNDALQHHQALQAKPAVVHTYRALAELEHAAGNHAAAESHQGEADRLAAALDLHP